MKIRILNWKPILINSPSASPLLLLEFALPISIRTFRIVGTNTSYDKEHTFVANHTRKEIILNDWWLYYPMNNGYVELQIDSVENFNESANENINFDPIDNNLILSMYAVFIGMFVFTVCCN